MVFKINSFFLEFAFFGSRISQEFCTKRSIFVVSAIQFAAFPSNLMFKILRLSKAFILSFFLQRIFLYFIYSIQYIYLIMTIKEAVNQENYCDNYNSTVNLTAQVGLPTV